MKIFKYSIYFCHFNWKIKSATLRNTQCLYNIQTFVSPVACIARLPPLAPQTAVDSRIEPSEEKVNMSENIVDIKNNMRMLDIQHSES